jgi:PKD repeat protein
MLRTIKLLHFVVLLMPALAFGQNRPPVVDAGPDQYMFTNDTTSLIGSATDPDNDPIEAWQWTVESSPAVSNPQFSSPTLSSTTFLADTAGIYDVSLVASDGLVWSDPDYVNVFVADIIGPTAVATSDVTSGISPLTVQFDGLGSIGTQIFDGTSIIDLAGSGWDDGSFSGDLTYRWNFGDQTALSFDASATHTYTSPGTYTAILDVYDELGNSDLATLQITVNAVPVPSAVWLFGSGLIGLVGMARRRRKTV